MLKFDGVIEAVRYKNGKIALVRAYERRGPTFSDHILLNRKDLLERLRAGKRFVTGRRKPLLASTFEIDKEVRIIGQDGNLVITTRPNAERDDLENVPLF